MRNRLIATLVRCGLGLSAVTIASSGPAYGQYWSNVYYCTGVNASPVTAPWYGQCVLHAESDINYVHATALVGTYMGAWSASALSYVDESYQEIEVHATINISGTVYSHGRKCQYDQDDCYDVGEALYIPPYYWAYINY